MRKIELKESSMSFKLEDGSVLLISKNDITELANKLIVEMMLNKQNVIYSLKNNSIEKCNLLYKIIVEQKDTMSKTVKEQYLKSILEFISENDSELETLKDKIEEQK